MENNTKIHEQNKAAYEHLNSGGNMSAMAKEEGVHRSTLMARAARYRAHLRERERFANTPELLQLPTRARNCLLSKGYNSIEKITDGVKSGEINPESITDYGKKAYKITVEWLKENGVEV